MRNCKVISRERMRKFTHPRHILPPEFPPRAHNSSYPVNLFDWAVRTEARQRKHYTLTYERMLVRNDRPNYKLTPMVFYGWKLQMPDFPRG